MVLEINDSLNIKNIAIPEPEKVLPLPFNPDRAISQAKWDELYSRYEANPLSLYYKSESSDEDDHDQLIAMAFVSPDNCKKRNPKNIEQWNMLKIDLEVWDGSLFGRILKEAVIAKLLHPEEYKMLHFEEHFSPEVKEAIRAMITTDLPDWFLRHEDLIRLKMIFSHYFPDEIPDQFKTETTHLLTNAYNKKAWDAYALYGFILKILSPDNLPPIDEKAWQGMNEALEIKEKLPNQLDFIQMAMYMKALAMKEIKITPESIEQIPSTGIATKYDLPIPEVRNF